MKTASAVICREINKSFSGRRVIKDFSLTVEDGEMVCLRGPSGCGKTTLLNIIGLIDRPDSGSIELFGETAPKGGSGSAQRVIRTKINFILQNFALIESQSVEKNLALALRYVHASNAEKHELIKSAIEKVGLGSSLDKKVAQLSGGEQQRIALARCMIKPGRLIIADEPTGSLDQGNRDIVISLLRRLVDRGKTVILATHDEKVASSCDKIITL